MTLIKSQHLDYIKTVMMADSAKTDELIQSLWSGYGEILRISLQGTTVPSVVVKFVQLPEQVNHPRGWNSDHSHARKVQSYRVEMAWYSNWSARCNTACKLPACYSVKTNNNEQLMILEDLDYAGFSVRKTSLNNREIQQCLRWLANFHALFLGIQATDLWPIGSYWHLATRPDEYQAMPESALKKSAHLIDERLNNAQYKTLIHGDAKIANFCFADNGKSVAAVDFQYVGSGCGMKDVAYFMGSCLDEQQCENEKEPILDYYFAELTSALQSLNKKIDIATLEREWRLLFPLAWTDFYRFLLGWMPGHWKINSYSQSVAENVIPGLNK